MNPVDALPDLFIEQMALKARSMAQGAVVAELIAIKAVQILFANPPASIGDIELDASVHETHRTSAKATRHPVEAEAGDPGTITDHVLVEPITIQIDGIITNTPVELLAGAFSLGQDPVHDSYEELVKNVLLGKVVTVVTTLWEYENMLIENLEVTRDVKKGNALHFSATATQIFFASLKTQKIKLKRPTRQATQNAGQATATAPPLPPPPPNFASVTQKLKSMIPIP
jgi:hypothetical protein